MPRLKRGSAVLDTAQERLTGLKTITPAPNFGAGLDLPHYEQAIEMFGEKLEAYNSAITTLDRLQNEVIDAERQLRDLNRRMLSATGAQYGTNSYEYETVGGTRDSERKSPTKKNSGNDSDPQS